MNTFIHNKILGLFVKTDGSLSRPLYGGRGVILAFHRIHSEKNRMTPWNTPGMALSPDALEKVIHLLKKMRYAIVNLDEAVEILKSRATKKFAVLTFDDGYRDNLEFAYPVCKKNGVPLTIYIATDFPDHKNMPWTNLLSSYIAKHEAIDITLIGKRFQCKTGTDGEKAAAFGIMRRHIVDSESTMEKEVFARALGSGIEQVQDINREENLSWAEIAEMSRDSLVSIGAHGVHHRALSKLSEDDALSELVDSKKRLEACTGKKVGHFAYPYGTSDECGPREYSLAERAGYATAVTFRQANVFKEHLSHLMALPRISVSEANIEERIKNTENGIYHFSVNGFRRIVT